MTEEPLDHPRHVIAIRPLITHRRRDYPTLLAPIIPLLPPSPGDEPLALKIWTEDAGLRIVSGSVLAKSRELAKQGLGK